jgi:hypothetical protein
MRFSAALFVMTVGVVRVASAQGDPAPTDPGQPVAPEPPTPPTPPPPPPPPPMHHDTMVAPAEGEHEVHPTGLAFGIGIGYALPTSLETPNTASMRLRLPSGLTFEPRVALANSSQTMKDPTMSTTDSTSEVLLETAIRKALVEHGRYEFEVIGGVALDITKQDPMGDNNSRTTTDVGLFWGIGVGTWITPHWQFSFDIENPLISYASTNQETGAGTSTTNSTTNIGAVFNPNVVMMIHLYN